MLNNTHLQRAVRDWIDTDHWHYPFAVTLTLKQSIYVHTAGGRHRVSLTHDYASQNLNHFLNVLDKQVYGSAAQRYNKHLQVLPVLEGGNGTRLHYHLIIDCPRGDLIESFPSMIIQAWRKTQWGYDQTDIKPAHAASFDYVTKLRDKPDFGRAIDWLNYHAAQ